MQSCIPGCRGQAGPRRVLVDHAALLTTACWAISCTLAAAGGCRLAGDPVPRSLVTCRQLSQQGLCALEQQEWAEAENLLGRAVEACRVDPEARRHYAEALWRQGNADEAVTQIEAALQLAPNDPVPLIRAAQMHLALGQVEAAHRHVERAIDLDPQSAPAWTVRGRVRRQTGLVREALADYHRALSYAPEDREALLEVAELHRQLNEPESALATLQFLSDTYPPGEEPQQVLYLMGLAYAAVGRPRDAVESLAAARDTGQPSAEILYRLAEAELEAGQRSQARSTIAQALEVEPRHSAGNALLDRIELAREPGNRFD